MKIATAKKEKTVKAIEARRVLYNKLFNNGKEEFNLMDNNTLNISRKELYDEIWEHSLSKTAKKYNVSYAKLKQACIDANIPTPSNSYWTNLSMGNAVDKEPLPSSDTEKVLLYQSKSNYIKPVTNDLTSYAKDISPSIFKDRLLFLSDAEKQKILNSVNELKIDDNEKLHPKLVRHNIRIKTWKQSHPLDPYASRKRDSYSRPPEGEPFLYKDVSELSIQRIYKLLSPIFKCIEALGGSINDDLSLTIRNEIVRYQITEAEDKIPHVLTKDEQKATEQYERDKLRYKYAYPPNFRKWDYVFNGKLRFSILSNRHYRDSNNTLIEQRLAEILIDLYEESENVRIKREEREAAARKAEEERKEKERRLDLYNEEVERITALENEAEDYATACKIRAYISAVESKQNLLEEDKRWIEWAKNKADWYDPTIKREDDLFGLRDHKKSKEQKTPKKSYSYFGW